MEPTSPYRPSVSRETRRLLTAGALAVAALWLLARIRFEERPLTPNPVPSVLSQLAAPPSYDDLAQTIAQVQARLEPSLLALETQTAEAGPAPRRAALRLRDDLALLVLPQTSTTAVAGDARVVARDPISGLAVARVAPGATPEPSPSPWTPRRVQQPRYFIATDVSVNGVSLRPVFVGGLDWLDSPWWPEPVWAVPARAGLTAGDFVFTSSAEFVGVVVTSGAGLVLVPGETAVTLSTRLLEQPAWAPGEIGVAVQALTPAVAALTGATQGVVVTSVAASDGAPSALQVGDVIEAVGSQPMTTRQHWDARIARLQAGEALALRVRRSQEIVTVTVKAVAAPTPPATPAPGLGLVLRAVPSQGAEVTRLESGSAGERAGLRRGDVITRVAGIVAPTPTELTRAYAALAPGQSVMLAVTRADTHHVLVLSR